MQGEQLGAFGHLPSSQDLSTLEVAAASPLGFQHQTGEPAP